MSPPNLHPVSGPAPPPDIPAFADLAADPEIAPLLGFEPVVRKIRRPDGWTDELQRELIARLAATGTVQAAVWQMGKHATGAEALYKTPSADSFRASWDAAVAIGRRRNGLDSHPPYAGPIPGITRRGQKSPSPPLGGEGWGEGEISEAEHESLCIAIWRSYLKKVQEERQARLEGRVVAADFALRQVTFFEVALDLAQEHGGPHGVDTWTWLASLRRDGHNLIDIARTPFSQFLDEARRLAWAGPLDETPAEPPRPGPTPEELLLDRNGYSLEPVEGIQGGKNVNFQREAAKLEERHRKAAQEQLAWEASQIADRPA